MRRTLARTWRLLNVPLLSKRREPLAGEEATWAWLESERTLNWFPVALWGQAGMKLSLLLGLLINLRRLGPPPPGESNGPLYLQLISGILLLSIMALGVWMTPALGRRFWNTRFAPKPRYTARTQRRLWKLTWWTIGAVIILAVGLLAIFDSNFWDFLSLAGGSAASAALLCYGLRARQGREPCCLRCGYPAGSNVTQWVRCPECGADLSRKFAVVLGNDVRRPLFVFAGIAGFVACVIGWMIKFPP